MWCGRLDLRYGYDRVGNITAITDTVNSGQVQTFGYDARDRWIWARTNGVGNGQYNEAYGYDRMGNILTRTVGSQLVAYTYACPPPGVSPPSDPPPSPPPTLPHRVFFPLVMKDYGPHIPPEAACVAGFAVIRTTAGFQAAYDPNGNMTLRVENGVTYRQEYDAENRLAVVTNTVTGEVVRFVYDGDGNRILRVGPEGTTVYVGDYYEKQGSAVTKYYYIAGQRVAVRVNGTLYFLHTDHLGSTTLLTDQSQQVVARLGYRPHGDTRYAMGNLPTDRRYTGQRWDGALALYDYRARYYDPLLGRFVSADPLVPEPGNPQALNRYAYVLNNPICHIDPSGHVACADVDSAGRCIREMSPRAPRPWVRFIGEWPAEDRAVVIAGVQVVGQALARVIREENRMLYRSGDLSALPRVTARGAFLRVYGDIAFRQVEAGTVNGWAWTRVEEMGEIWVDAVGTEAYRRWGTWNTVHELGHAFAQRAGRQPYGDLQAARISYINERGEEVIVAGGGWPGLGYQRTDNGYVLTNGQRWPWQQSAVQTANEDFADMFLGWAYNHFADDPAGAARYQWMAANMPHWIALAVSGTP